MINEFLAGIINWINSWLGNYGFSLIIFTVLIKSLLLPFDFKSRKSMRRTTMLQPKINALQKKYANDKDKLNQKMSELYKKEGINPLSGCLPMLLTFPILIFMFNAMRYVANTELAKQALEIIAGGTQTPESFLWIKNLWVADSPFSMVVADEMGLRMIPADVWTSVINNLKLNDPTAFNALVANGVQLEGIADLLKADPQYFYNLMSQTEVFKAEMAVWPTMPSLNLIITQMTIYNNPNGFFILPILAAVTQYAATLLQPNSATTDANSQAGGMNKIMKWGFPIFSLYICATSNASFALYWVISNVISTVQSLVMNKILDAREKKQAQEAAIGEGTVK